MKILSKIFPIDALKCAVEMRTPFLENQKKIGKNNKMFKHAVCSTINYIKLNNDDYFLRKKKRRLGGKSFSPLVVTFK